MKQIAFLLLTILFFCNCHDSNSQDDISRNSSEKKQPIGDACEGCSAIYACPVPFASLHWIDTLPDFSEKGPKLLISGTVYQRNGKTPAPDVVLYVYHTNQQGKYTNRFEEAGDAGRHGYIKGWIKTNKNGQYKFYTLKPGHYPGRSAPAHVHLIVKEPDKNEYWVDDVLFDDDPLLTATELARLQERGGKGLVQLKKEEMLLCTRDIFLGKNVPGYPGN